MEKVLTLKDGAAAELLLDIASATALSALSGELLSIELRMLEQ